jgi:hypothetical protein
VQEIVAIAGGTVEHVLAYQGHVTVFGRRLGLL